MQINIFDHLPEKTFIYIDEPAKTLLFNKLLITTLTDLSKDMTIKFKNFSRYKTGTRAMPKKIFLSLIERSELQLNDFQDKLTFKVGKRGNKLKIGPFLDIDSDWVYISGLITGDGSLVKGNNNSYSTCFTNKNQFLIQYVHDFFIKKGINPNNIGIYNNTKNGSVKNLVVHTEIISYLFNSFFKIPFGYKRDIFITDFIMNNKVFSIAVVAGIFDAEGTVQYLKKGNSTLRKVVIGMKDLNYLKDIQKILLSLNIKSIMYKEKDRNMYRLVMGDRNSIIRFYRIIKPLHPDRCEKLRNLVASYNQSYWICSEDIMPKILKLLLKGSRSREDISKTLKISNSMAKTCLNKLRNKGLVLMIKTKGKKSGPYFLYHLTKFENVIHLKEGGSPDLS